MTTPGRLVAQRYRLQSQIGGGGMGTVWLARDELLGRQVAVKQVITIGGADPQQMDEQRQRAMREGRIAARLSHPHAISVYDVALENDQPWLVMEYLPSRSLAEVLRDDGALRTDVVAQIGAQVADALAATHAAGIVHRDVKPANILIGQGSRVDGLVKITDFGISHASGDVTLTQTGQITGTPAFLAPEVAQGQEMTEASDVFSLGATLYTCLEGQPPFGMEDNALAMLHRVAGGNIRPPVRAASLSEPLLRMLASDPADRPTMTEVRDELARLAAGRNGDTTTVLLARTDLGSGGAGRSSTSAFPPPPPATATPPQPLPVPADPPRTLTAPPATPVPAAAGAVGAVPGAAPGPAPAATGRDDRVAPSPPARPGARRRRSLWLAVAAVALLLTGLGIFWAVSGDGPDSPTTSAEDSASAPTSSAATSSEEATTEPTTETTEAPTSSAATTEPTTQEPSQPPADPLSAANITAFLTEYHQLVLSDPRAAYARTGPTLRANISEANYIAYWQQFSDVRVTDIDAADGRNTAAGTLEWTYTDGSTESGRRVFTFLVQDGQLILDSDFQA